MAAYCPFKVLKPLWDGKVCLCSINSDLAWGFCGRSLCKLEPGRSGVVLDFRNKKPRARGKLSDWWIGGLVDWWIGGLVDWPNENPNRSRLWILRILDNGIQPKQHSHIPMFLLGIFASDRVRSY